MTAGRGDLAERVDRAVLDASLEFLALLVVLLFLPNEELDLLFGLNPRRVWSVVVFVAGVSFLGFLLSKVVKPRAAIGIAGALGGAVSPGATIASLAEQRRRHPKFGPDYAFAAAVAATMLFPRNFVVVAIVAPDLARSLALSFAAMAGVGALVTGLFWSRHRGRDPPANELETPFEVRSALAIGAAVAGILVLVETVDVSVPSNGTRIGVVVATQLELTAYVGVSGVTGSREMARVVGGILLGSASAGIAAVLL